MELTLPYDYRECVAASERVSWKLDDLFPVGTALDFSHRFLPESLAQTANHAAYLSAPEQRTLNHIMGHSYANLFAFVEEYILLCVVERTHAKLAEEHGGDHIAIRALGRFADEEVKHQELFARYRAAFNRDFGMECEVLENAHEVARVMAKKGAIAALLMVLHIELMTQTHYTESVHADDEVDPLFARLLKHHCLEEVQHARIDALELQRLVATASHSEITVGFEGYLDLLDAMSGLLRGQAEMDVRSLERKVGRRLADDARGAMGASQHARYMKMFLWMGMTHPTFVDLTTRIDATCAADVRLRADRISARLTARTGS